MRQKITFKKIKSELERKLKLIKGVLVEDKALSLTLHYRLVALGGLSKVFAVLRKTIYNYLKSGKIKVRNGKKSVELRPNLDWDKGKAVAWILSKLKSRLPAKNIRPIYIGDDVTDEDAFKALGNKGISIFVGYGKSSCAKYYLKNTTEVKRTLNLIEDNRYGNSHKS